MKTATTQEKKQ